MNGRLNRALRGLFFVCLWLLALPAMAQIRNEGAIPDGRGGVGVLALGMNHTCGLRPDGTASCWGDNYSGQATPLAGTFIELSSGFEHTCGLRGDGTVACWGRGYTARDGEPQPPAPPPAMSGTFTALASGVAHTCGIRALAEPWQYTEGNVACWTTDGWAPLPSPPAGNFVALSLGFDFACGLRADGRAECWGYVPPETAVPEGAFLAVSVGARHACGLRADGSVECWGDNGAGQATPPAELFTAITTGAFHTCGLRTDSRVQCWGQNWGGESTPPAEEQDRFIAIAAGDHHTCGVRMDGQVACWGQVNWNFQYPQTPPQQMPYLRPFEGVFGVGQLAAGDWHHCQVTPEGRLSCWGGFDADPAPWARFSAVASGDDFSCGRSQEGRLECFGYNEGLRQDLPVEPLRQFDLGYEHGCAVQALDGRAKCWGRETNGKTIAPEGLFRDLSAGLMHSCGVGADGNGQCWGYDGDGQSAVPTLPSELRFLSIQAGERHSCGLDSDMHIKCWGMSPPPLSFDPYAYPWDPQNHPDFATFRALSVGTNHSCAIRTDGRLLCWGADWNGQLQAPEGTFVAVSAGRTHTCAIRTDGRRECWGEPFLEPRLMLYPEHLYGVRSNQWFDVRFELRSESGYQVQEPRYAIVAGTLPPGFSLDRYGSLHGSWHETGRYPITVEGRDRNGFAVRRDYVLSIDDTPPVIEPQVTGTLGENGWYTSPVDVQWSVTDPESEIRWRWGCDPAEVHNETSGAGFLCHAESTGGMSLHELQIKLDQIPPHVVLLRFEPQGALATFEFEGHDFTSGIAGFECSLDGAEFAPCVSPLQSTFAPGEHEMQIRAVDAAGHRSEPVSQRWFADATAPMIEATVTGPLGMNDWYVGDAQIQWQLRDDESMISSVVGCETATLGSDALQASYTCTATSLGGTTTQEVSARRDSITPDTELTSTPVFASNATSASFEFSGYDATSGVVGYECQLDGSAYAACSSPKRYDNLSHGSHTFHVRAIDAAGLRDDTPQDYAFVVDITPPVVEPRVSGQQGEDGWYVGDVQIAWDVSESDSALTTSGCNTVLLNTDTAGANFTCTATSAGGSVSRTVTIKRDATAPVVIAAATTAPNVAGWYNAAVTVGFECSDALSGVVSACASQTLSAEGSSTSSAFTVRDAAGNTASSGTVAVRIDRIAPTLAPVVSPSTLLLNATTTAAANGADSGSGIASEQCAALATGTVGSKTVTCTVTDAAGNSANASASYRVIYGFVGFNAPVKNPTTLNTFKAGKSVPFRWRVVDAQGAPVSNLTTASVAATAISCPSIGGTYRITEFGSNNSQLQNLGNGYYQLDWATPSSYINTCKRLDLSLGDGEAHPALFKFTWLF